MKKIDMRVETLVVDPQEVITRDNVTAQVDAVVYYRVVNAQDAIIKVVDYAHATSQVALTTLRSVLGQSDLDELLSHRDRINERLQKYVDDHTEPWGVEVQLVEVKDVLLPERLQRTMARQAEAEREKRAKIIHADGERLAADALAEAADRLSQSPISLQLRYLQTLVEVASEQNATILAIPLDIIRQTVTAIRGNDHNQNIGI
jgi:regulator of protease activity HflC (stomatin/prohibitin superfamily)